MDPGKPVMKLVKNSTETDLMLITRIYSLPSNNITVTLLPAMHVGKTELYEKHNQILAHASVVLYEGKGLDKKGFVWQDLPELKKIR